MQGQFAGKQQQAVKVTKSAATPTKAAAATTKPASTKKRQVAHDDEEQLDETTVTLESLMNAMRKEAAANKKRFAFIESSFKVISANQDKLNERIESLLAASVSDTQKNNDQKLLKLFKASLKTLWITSIYPKRDEIVTCLATLQENSLDVRVLLTDEAASREAFVTRHQTKILAVVRKPRNNYIDRVRKFIKESGFWPCSKPKTGKILALPDGWDLSDLLKLDDEDDANRISLWQYFQQKLQPSTEEMELFTKAILVLIGNGLDVLDEETVKDKMKTILEQEELGSGEAPKEGNRGLLKLPVYDGDDGDETESRHSQ